ncbi:DNA internalization-related competence protein ComEC/Rec2 [Dyella sp. C9]|uniref:DNA internalization-related competence protein ComEC/Rec2 n=1 Tax=Dyella sp. C9 TaxID=2202154 RepID=UPI000DEEA919|nr:DNA internalization-related competence protein ComEC/Rec2 [Dyella sp. C9]
MRQEGAAPAGVMLLSGVLATQWLNPLPPRWMCLVLMAVAGGAMLRGGRVRLLAWCLLGMAWASLRGGSAMDARLPRELEGQDIQLSGQLIDLPKVGPDSAGFLLRVDGASVAGTPLDLHGRVRVNWYNGAPPLRACSRWQLTVRAKRPRGLLNPGGGDAERSALERGVVASGYVRDAAEQAASWCIDSARERISRGIAERIAVPRDTAFVQALAVGDTRGFSNRDWDVARANGISHLIAISGFHVGVAASFGVWLARLLYLCLPTLALRLPRPQLEAGVALLLAAVYSALAGFGLATVRSLLMIAVVAWARCLRRQPAGLQSLALALVVVLVFDPLCVLSAGFWLSFAGVAFLMLCLVVRARGLRGFLHELTMAQLAMSLALLPLTLWFFGQASLVGGLANLVAVPFVSLVIVPCTLMGVLLLGLCPPAATPVLWCAGKLVHLQWWLLDLMAGWPGAHWYLPDVRLVPVVLAMIGATWLLMPRGVPARWLGGLLFLPLLFPPRNLPLHGGFQLWMLDVGQGLSVLVRTRHHALLYDAGARYPSEFDLGEAAVLPSMRALGLGRLDLLVASHADNDHAGGIPAVAAAYPDAERRSGEPERLPLPMAACAEGQSWQWDGVTVQVLRVGARTESGNDRSCVILVEGVGGRALLTGDISSRVEPAVVASLPPGPPLVLTVPHHGSRSSSSAAFIAATDPVLALFSAGWRNRFRHPHPLVVERYEKAGVAWLNTATAGAIQVDVPPDGPPRVVARWRQRQSRYWRE